MSESSTVTAETARRFQQAGDLRKAEEIFHQLLQSDPNQAEALHGLGAIAYQRGQFGQAVEWLRKAVAVQGTIPGLHSNLGAAYQAAGQLAEAEACYLQALRLQPDLAEAYNNLGNVLRQQGRLDEAVARYRQAVLARPNFAEAHNNLGLALTEQGNGQEALNHYRQAARVRPNFAQPQSNWGLLLRQQGQLDEAVSHLRQALRLKPNGAKEHLHLAVALREKGELEEALSHFREALRLQPDVAETHLGLGIVLLTQDQIPEAMICFEQALRLKPALLEAHYYLGHALLRQEKPNEALSHFRQSRRFPPGGEKKGTRPLKSQVASPFSGQGAGGNGQGAKEDHGADSLNPLAEAYHRLSLLAKAQKQWDQALRHCREALRLNSDFAQAYVTLGLTLLEGARFEEAVTAFQHALRVKPNWAEAYLHLGTALREQGSLERSAAYLQQALRLRPNLAPAHFQLGRTLHEKGKLDEAREAYREALRLQPNSVPVLSHLGNLLEELGQLDEGNRLLEQALALGPEDCQVHAHCAAALVNQGRVEEARAHFLKALALQPDFSPAHFALARDSHHHFPDADLARIKDLLNREFLPLRDRINLHLALARTLDGAKAFDEAFWHCNQANAYKKQLLQLQGNAFDANAHTQFIDRLIATFDRDYFCRVRSFGSDSELAVFIVGMPRSGTSLVEQILASHPAVFGAGEIRTMRHLVAELPAELGSAAEYPECLAGLDQAASRRLAERYLEGLRRLGGDKLRVTDKVPMNFHQLGLIATLLPRAQIIHCQRDPRDTCWSCYFQNFREVPFACDLRTLGAYHRRYERLMAYWKEVLPLPILEVRYEQLVADLERISREIVAFCKLPWHESCLAFYETRRTVRTSSNLQVRQPVYQSSVGYWKNYEAHLGPLLEALAPDVRE